MGYSAGTTLNYVADSAGTAVAFDTLARSTTQYRSLAGASFKFAGDDTTEDDDDVDAKVKKKAAAKKVKTI
jgi:hypothetical protein